MKITREYLRRLIIEAISETDDGLRYSSEKQCLSDGGEFCYFYDKKNKQRKAKAIKNEPTQKTVTVSKPVKLKKEDKMIKIPASEDILRKNERELENILASDETSDALRAVIIDEIGDLEDDKQTYEALFSKPGAVQRFMEKCLDRLS